MCLLVVILLIFSLSSFTAEDNCDISSKPKPAHLRLKETLLECGYDLRVRPVVNHGNRTTVTLTMKLRSLFLDVYTRSMHVHCWMIWEWQDEHLHWNPSDYEGVDLLNVGSDEIWVPEVAQFVSTSAWEVERRIPYGSCEVTPNGNVKCMPDTMYYALCAEDLMYWPYDDLNCSLRLGAWMQKGEEITIRINDNIVDVHEYETNREWILLSATVTRHVEKYEGNNTFPWIQYSFFMRRHASLYEATVVLPGILLGILVLTTFWQLPHGSNRINLCCVTVICHYLQLQYVGWTLGTGGNKCPLVVLFYRDSMLLACLALVTSVIARCLVSTTAIVPPWVSKVTHWILSCRVGQIILLSETSSQVPATVETSEEEATKEDSEAVKATIIEPINIWKVFVKIFDYFFFLIFLSLYTFMIIRCFL